MVARTTVNFFAQQVALQHCSAETLISNLMTGIMILQNYFAFYMLVEFCHSKVISQQNSVAAEKW